MSSFDSGNNKVERNDVQNTLASDLHCHVQPGENLDFKQTGRSVSELGFGNLVLHDSSGLTADDKGGLIMRHNHGMHAFTERNANPNDPKWLESTPFYNGDLTGFEREAPYKSNSVWDSVLHGIKHTFVHDDTVGDKVRKDVESKMTPEERAQFDKETQEMDEFRRKLAQEGRIDMIRRGETGEVTIGPKVPESPMHDEIARRVQNEEKAIAHKVLAGMSPAEIRELNKEFADMTTKITPQDLRPEIDMLRLPVKPGPAIEEYYRRINEATDEYMKSHQCG